MWSKTSWTRKKKNQINLKSDPYIQIKDDKIRLLRLRFEILYTDFKTQLSSNFHYFFIILKIIIQPAQDWFTYNATKWQKTMQLLLRETSQVLFHFRLRANPVTGLAWLFRVSHDTSCFSKKKVLFHLRNSACVDCLRDNSGFPMTHPVFLRKRCYFTSA